MMRLIALFFAISIAGCTATAPDQHSAASSPELPEPTLSLKTFEALVENDQADSVLVIFDIDDTLLESRHFYGGDTWYNWQRGRPVMHESGTEVRIAEADKVACIFSQLTLLYELGHYEPVEPDAVEIFNRMASQHDVLLLTSRSPAYRPGTERELTRHGFNVTTTHLLPEGEGFATNLNDGSRTAPIVYLNGIAMTSGLNKGVVLRDILTRIKKQYDAVYFIDDGAHNIKNMNAAWRGDRIPVTSVWYRGVDKTVSDADITAARRSNAAMETFISAAYPERLEKYKVGRCSD